METGVKGGGPGCLLREWILLARAELMLEMEETLLPENDVEEWKLELKLLRSGNEEIFFLNSSS